MGGLLDLVSSAWINWFNAILFAALLVLELFYMPETLYPRQKMLLHQSDTLTNENTLSATEKQESKGAEQATEIIFGAFQSNLGRTKSLPFVNLRPIPGMRHPKPWDSITRFFITFKFPTVSIAVIGYSFVWYWWVLSVITMVPAAYVNYTPLIQGLLFLGLLLGTIVSEIFCSGRLSDYIVEKLAKKRGNVRVAEMRLWLAYPAILVTAGKLDEGPGSLDLTNSVVGSILWGVSVDKNYHWMVGQIAFFLCKT